MSYLLEKTVVEDLGLISKELLLELANNLKLIELKSGECVPTHKKGMFILLQGRVDQLEKPATT